MVWWILGHTNNNIGPSSRVSRNSTVVTRGRKGTSPGIRSCHQQQHAAWQVMQIFVCLFTIIFQLGDMAPMQSTLLPGICIHPEQFLHPYPRDSMDDLSSVSRNRIMVVPWNVWCWCRTLLHDLACPSCIYTAIFLLGAVLLIFFRHECLNCIVLKQSINCAMTGGVNKKTFPEMVLVVCGCISNFKE